ncbi:Long-chain base-1-phosphate phosphatase [Thecaphora frezii]
MTSERAHQPTQWASRQASSFGSIDEDSKVGGSWIDESPRPVIVSSVFGKGAEGDSAAASAATPTAGQAPDEIRSRIKQGAKRVEKIHRVGLLGGSSAAAADQGSDQGEEIAVIGIQGDELYNNFLPRPVAAIRSVIVSILRKEGPYMARHQIFIRRPWLDLYFVNTSLLGTHSFFLIFLPMAFWLGNARFARGLVNVLAFGVYFASALKDLFCVPRPYSPPVTRLTIGTHHLEYGFPSTHSTNSVSMALYLYLWVTAFRQLPLVAEEYGLGGVFDSLWWEVGLLFYAFSVVYGRIYAGMHSITDCTVGSLLGGWLSWMQWRYFDHTERFLLLDSWMVPLSIVSTCLVMVSVHPQPLEDCPCFEDAIAFISVAMGTMLGKWFSAKYGLRPSYDDPLNPLDAAQKALLGTKEQLASPSALGQLFEPILDALKQSVETLFGQDGTGVKGTSLRVLRSTVYLLLGVVSILLLRVVVKAICMLVLPPLLRFVSRSAGFSLPRRHYTPANQYNKIPLTDLTAVPSVIDLPSTIMVTDEHGTSQDLGRSGEARDGAASASSSSSLGGRGGANGELRNRLSAHAPRVPVTPAQSSPTSSLFSTSPLPSPVPSRTPSPALGQRVGSWGAAGRGPTKQPGQRVQFTIGGPDGDAYEGAADLPIPLTQSQAHPDFVALDEKVAQRLAATVDGSLADKAQSNVKHYDAEGECGAQRELRWLQFTWTPVDFCKDEESQKGLTEAAVLVLYPFWAPQS